MLYIFAPKYKFIICHFQETKSTTMTEKSELEYTESGTRQRMAMTHDRGLQLF